MLGERNKNSYSSPLRSQKKLNINSSPSPIRAKPGRIDSYSALKLIKGEIKRLNI